MNVTRTATALTSTPAPAQPLRLVGMSATALRTRPAAPPRRPLADVHRLPHPLDPTPEEVAAKKAKRRLGKVTYSRTQAGSFRARHFNAAGFDCYGYDEHGHHDPTQASTELPTIFTH